MNFDSDKLKDDKLEEVRAGIEAMQQDQARRNVEEEINRMSLRPDEVFTAREQAAIKSLVHDALVEFFRAYGLRGKNTIITTGIVLSALVGIIIALKTIAGWIGIGFINR